MTRDEWCRSLVRFHSSAVIREPWLLSEVARRLGNGLGYGYGSGRVSHSNGYRWILILSPPGLRSIDWSRDPIVCFVILSPDIRHCVPFLSAGLVDSFPGYLYILTYFM